MSASTRNAINNYLKQICLMCVVFVGIFMQPYCFAEQEQKPGISVGRGSLQAEDVPLMQAIKEGDETKARRLIKQGADVNVKVFNDFTPLHSAVQENHLEIARLLIKNGADVNAKMLHTITPLYLAAERGNLDMTKLLLKAGAEIGFFEAMAATQYEHLDILEYFKKQGFDITQRFKGGTLLHVAAAYGNVEVVKWLIENGVPVNVVDERGQTPLSIAAGNTEVEEILRQHDAEEGTSLDFESLSRSAGFALEQQKYHEAMTKYELALKALDPEMESYDTYKLLTLFYLTYAYLGESELAKARKTAEEYIAAFKPELKISEQNLADMHKILAKLDFQIGDHQGTIDHMTAVTSIYERTSRPGAPILAKAYFDLGALYNGIKQQSNAETAFKNTLRVYRENANPDVTQLSEIEFNVAQVLREEGKYTEAKELFLNIRDRLSKADESKRNHILLHGAIYGLAFIAKEEGRYKEADKLYTITKQEIDNMKQPDHPMVRKFYSEYEEVKQHLKEQSE